jgi:hypothetical protein
MTNAVGTTQTPHMDLVFIELPRLVEHVRHHAVVTAEKTHSRRLAFATRLAEHCGAAVQIDYGGTIRLNKYHGASLCQMLEVFERREME